MSLTHDHAACPTQIPKSPKMEVPQREQRPTEKKTSLFSKDNTTIASGGTGSQRNKQSLDYALKTGLAGGLAGIAVRAIKHLHCVAAVLTILRLRQWLALLIASRFFSKLPVPNSPNTQGIGLGLSLLCATSTVKMASEAYSAVTRPQSFVSFPTLLSSLLPMSKSAMYLYPLMPKRLHYVASSPVLSRASLPFS